jgi:hypothetical protein
MSGWTTVTENTQPAPPAGWTPVNETPSSKFGEGTVVTNKADEYAAKALSAAGLPTSIANVPDWFMHLIGQAKDSKPVWEAAKKAIEEPTQENIVGAIPLFGPVSVAMARDVRDKDYGGALATLAGAGASIAAAGQVGPGVGALKQMIGPGTIPQKIYQSALKPPPGSYSTVEVNNMVKTGLENKIPVSAGGVDKLNGLVSNYARQVQAQIDAGATAGQSVNKFAVASRLGDTAQKFATQVNPAADLGAVGSAGNEFLENQPTSIPVGQAQKLKTGTYQQLGGKAYGELSSASVEAQKALARGIKEELQIQFPEIKGLNAKESQLYDLQPALERAVRRIDNHDIISLGSKAMGGVGAVVGGAGGAVAGSVMEKVLGAPWVKSQIAIALHRAGVPMPTALARVAAYTGAATASNPQSGQTPNTLAPQGTP